MIVRTLNTRRGFLLALVALPLLCGCSEGSYAENTVSDQNASPTESTDPIKIVALGDSLTAGYGLDDLSLAFPARLEDALKAEGYNVDVIDAGISGDTTSGGRSRLDWSLADDPDGVIVGLGGNDGLRAIDPEVTYDNLNAILARLESEGIPALLAGMMAPPNLGREYGDRFFAAYTRLAEQHDVVFYPFLLDGVAGERSLNQDDGIHPNEAGVDVMVERILPFAVQLVERAQQAKGSAADS